MRRGTRSLAGFLTQLVVVGCASPSPAPTEHPAVAIGNAAPHRVTIAVVAATSGPTEALGTSARGGVEIAMAIVHDETSVVPGVEAVDVLDVDAGSGTLVEVRTAAHTILGRTDVIAVIAALDPDATVALAVALKRSTASLITTTGNAPLARNIDLLPDPSDEATAAGRLIGEVLHAHQPATLTTAGSASFAEVAAFKRSVERFTQPTIEQSYPFAVGGGTDPLGDLARAGVDAVYVPAPPDRVGFALRQARLHNLPGPYVVPSSWQSPEALALLDAVNVRVYEITPVALDDGEPITTDFVDRYRQRVGGVPDVTAAMAFDAVQVTMAALAAAENPLDPEAVANAMHGLGDIPSLSGPLAIDRQGHARRPLAIRERFGGTDAFTRRIDP